MRRDETVRKNPAETCIRSSGQDIFLLSRGEQLLLKSLLKVYLSELVSSCAESESLSQRSLTLQMALKVRSMVRSLEE